MSVSTLFSSLLAIIISLAFVIALAWGTLWLLKRFQDGSFGRLSGANDGPAMKFEKALPVGPRERLVLVEVEGEQMLLGVTAHSITPLKTWPVSPSLDEEPASGADPDRSEIAQSKKTQDAARRFRLRIADSKSVSGEKTSEEAKS